MPISAGNIRSWEILGGRRLVEDLGASGRLACRQGGVGLGVTQSRPLGEVLCSRSLFEAQALCPDMNGPGGCEPGSKVWVMGEGAATSEPSQGAIGVVRSAGRMGNWARRAVPGHLGQGVWRDQVGLGGAR